MGQIRVHDIIALDPPLMADGVARTVLHCIAIRSEAEVVVSCESMKKGGKEHRFILLYDRNGYPERLIPFSQSVLRVRHVA
ncbi:MAG: hypothetical protein WAZ27_01785 [Minisyncoccia bacterium]